MATTSPSSASPTLITPTTTTTTTTATTTLATPPSSTPQATTPTDSTNTTFTFPPHHSFPPFYTLQPNLSTLSRQLTLWSALITAYCASTSTFSLSLSSASSLPLFNNRTIHRSLDVLAIRKILDYMTTSEGDLRAEWVPPTTSRSASGSGSKKLADSEKTTARIWWKRPEEWGEEIAAWVDETGQKGVVLTVYELRESDAVAGKEWVGMDEAGLRRCLEGLVRRGKAQVFEGQGGDGAGVKFF